MPRKRKTRQEKVILQLKRQLAQQTKQKPAPSSSEGVSQGANVKVSFEPKPRKSKVKRTYKSVFFYDSALVKKDLIRSLILTLGIISLEFVLYLRLR